MSDLIPDEEQLAEANKRYPTDHEVDDPHGETGVARSDPYGYDATANEAFLEGAIWESGRRVSPLTREALEEVVGLLASYGEYVEVDVAIEYVRSLSRFSLPEPAETERRKVLKPIEDFMATVHGMNEMNVIRGLRKVIKGEHSTFTHEVRLSVYGAPCGHEVPSHYPNGYGECDDCKEERRGF